MLGWLPEMELLQRLLLAVLLAAVGVLVAIEQVSDCTSPDWFALSYLLILLVLRELFRHVFLVLCSSLPLRGRLGKVRLRVHLLYLCKI